MGSCGQGLDPTPAKAVIHPAADVSAAATIGLRTSVWDAARIREDAVIGDDCIVGRGAYIDFGVRVGDRVKIQNNALIYHGVTVGSGVFIGPAAVLTNDRYPRSITVDGVLAGSDDWSVSEIRLSEGCSIGANAVVVAGCDVGRFATVGAGAVVTHPVPAYGLVMGNPARLTGWVCACGHRLVIGDGTAAGRDYEGRARCATDGLTYDIAGGRCTPAVGE